MMKRALSIVLPVGALLLLMELSSGWQITSNLYWAFYGLTASNTAYDYLSSSFGKQYRFKSQMCDDGVCLHDMDWKCGFTIRSPRFNNERYRDWDEAVDACFGDLVSAVPLYTSLDKVRKMCGRRYMELGPETLASEEKCRAARGNWGQKGQLWTDEDALLRKAGH